MNPQRKGKEREERKCSEGKGRRTCTSAGFEDERKLEKKEES